MRILIAISVIIIIMSSTYSLMNIKGDINRDLKVTQQDVECVRDFILGKKEFTEKEIKRMDVNNDNEVDIVDLVKIQKKVIK